MKEIEVIPEGSNAYHAYKQRQSGASWEQIAEDNGYSSADSAMTAVNTYLQRSALSQSEEWRREALQLELDRFDSLNVIAWDQAMAGDLRAVDTVLKIMGHRAKLLQLDVPTNTNDGMRTLIVMGDTEEYVKSLKQVATEELEA